MFPLTSLYKGKRINDVTKDDDEFPWMKTKVTYTCDADDAAFPLEDLKFPKSFDVDCTKEMIFGDIFPYWKIPRINYPDVPEIYCAFLDECYNFMDFDPDFSSLNLTDTFDEVTFI